MKLGVHVYCVSSEQRSLAMGVTSQGEPFSTRTMVVETNSLFKRISEVCSGHSWRGKWMEYNVVG